MSLDGEIEKMNRAYAAEQEVAAKTAQQRSDAASLKQQLQGVLRNDGPLFITELHNVLAKRASELSAKINNPAKKLVVGYGSSTRQLLLSIGGRLLSNEIRFPCAFVVLPDTMDRLVKGYGRAQSSVEELPIAWRPKDGKVELLKDGNSQSLPDFADELIGGFLKMIAPGGY
jgi:hypothetical protein